MEDLSTENNWTYELGVEKVVDVSFYVFVGFMPIVQFYQQTQNNDTFYQPSVTNAQCDISTERYPDLGINCDHERDKFSHAYGEIVLFQTFD